MTRTTVRASRLAMGLALLALLIAAAAFAASSHTSSARHGVMTPFAGDHSKWQAIGEPTAGSDGLVRFGCQLSNPAGCYGPDQIRAAYGIQPLLDQGDNGAGRTIVIIDAYGSPTINTDLARFDFIWGLPAPPSFQIVSPFGIDATTPGNASGWAGETSLDVEWAHAIAPSANILLVASKSNDDSDILDATQWVLDNNAGDVVSQSFGEAEQCMGPTLMARQHQIFEGLTAKGITLFASSGDQGAGIPTCDGSAYFKATSTPASDPNVTSVGGTTLHADGRSGAYQSEAVWNESPIFGDAVAGGGGVSTVYPRPDFQAPVVKDVKMRTVPDVSYNAAVFNGVIVVFGGRNFRFGGTSSGSPQWAALGAITDQMAGGRIGAINKTLYKLGKGNDAGTFFHDVADGSSNSIPDLGTGTGTPIDGFSAVPGYDLGSGWGSPIASTLLPALAKPGLG